MKINEYFVAQEFLSETDYEQLMSLPEKMRLNTFFKLVDKRLINILTYLRKESNSPITVNNWHKGGKFQWRGLRTKTCTIGAKHSAHRKVPCAAVDFDIKDYTDDEVKAFVIKREKKLYALGCRRMESAAFAPTWCHLDLVTKRGYRDKIYIFNP